MRSIISETDLQWLEEQDFEGVSYGNDLFSFIGAGLHLIRFVKYRFRSTSSWSPLIYIYISINLQCIEVYRN